VYLACCENLGSLFGPFEMRGGSAVFWRGIVRQRVPVVVVVVDHASQPVVKIGSERNRHS
jgi:hypothetical protein